MSASVRNTGTLARLLVVTLLCSVGLLLGPVAGNASASNKPGVRHSGVHGLTTKLRAGTTGIDLFISWTPPTAEQQVGLGWTSVFFGDNPQPVLVFPPDSDATVLDVPPGTYRLGVEFDYGPRSSYTHSARQRMSVTVPAELPTSSASAAAAGGPGPGELSPRRESHKSAVRRIHDVGMGALPFAGLLAAGLLAVAVGALAVRRRRQRTP
jgi:hypothetical protein